VSVGVGDDGEELAGGVFGGAAEAELAGAAVGGVDEVPAQCVVDVHGLVSFQE